MAIDPRISIITLGVAHIETSSAFYERLGFVRSSVSRPDVTLFQLRGLVLALYPRAVLAEEVGVEVGEKSFPCITITHLVSSAAGVDAVLRFAVSCGATLLRAPVRAEWGGYSGYFADPDGHIWEIAHNPMAVLSAQGHLVLPR